MKKNALNYEEVIQDLALRAQLFFGNPNIIINKHVKALIKELNSYVKKCESKYKNQFDNFHNFGAECKSLKNKELNKILKEVKSNLK